MNCRQFQNDLFEYVEGSLPPAQRRAVDGHLATCPACRLRLAQEQQVAQTLAQAFQHHTAELTLPPDFAERLLATIPPKPVLRRPSLAEVLNAGWLRLLWPLALTAGLLLVCLPSARKFPAAPPAPAGGPPRPPEISIHSSVRLPAWTFRQEGQRVCDTLSYETIVANGTLPTGGHESLRPLTTGKLPL